jgi:hypothetical protein
MHFTTSSIIAGLVFGGVGYVAFVFGRKQQKARPLGLGVALMVYAWVVPDGWWLWLTGIALTVLLFWP